MTPYWFLFLLPVFGALIPLRLEYRSRLLSFLILSLTSISIMGFRNEIGGDWIPYLTYLNGVSGKGLLESIAHYRYVEPGFIAINWLCETLGFGIVGVNIIGASILLLGVTTLSKNQPLPYLALLVSVPYLIIVVGIGYSRQAIALGIILIALSTWNRKDFLFLECITVTVQSEYII